MQAATAGLAFLQTDPEWCGATGQTRWHRARLRQHAAGGEGGRSHGCAPAESRRGGHEASAGGADAPGGLRRVTASSPTDTLRIGTSGFVYASWKRRFYPADLPAPAWLSYYARHFDTVEINRSFYRLPDAHVFERWRAAVPPGFVFAVKFSRFGTHMKRLLTPRATIRRFLLRARRLGSHLGPVLVQLPPRWAPDLPRRDRFLTAAPRDVRWVVEVRDARWLGAALYELLRRHGAALCVHDLLPRHPDVVTTDFTYIRFHGVGYGGSYTRAQLRPWAAWIVRQRAAHTGVFTYFNNDADGHAVENARTLVGMVTQGA
jgi:uncharacterized protein YecE (DUF72 family)